MSEFDNQNAQKILLRFKHILDIIQERGLIISLLASTEEPTLCLSIKEPIEKTTSLSVPSLLQIEIVAADARAKKQEPTAAFVGRLLKQGGLLRGEIYLEGDGTILNPLIFQDAVCALSRPNFCNPVRSSYPPTDRTNLAQRVRNVALGLFL